ncbi:hypothetical protein Tco_1307811 [Tanacetum coccineum]
MKSFNSNKSLDSDSESEDTENEGPTAEDEDPAAGDECLAAGHEGLSMRVKSLSLGGDEAIPEGQQRVALVMEIAMGKPLVLGYRALRHREIALGDGRMPSVFEVDPEDGIAYINAPAYPLPAPPIQTSPSPEWSSGLLPISPAPSIVPSPVSSPVIPLAILSLVFSPAMDETKGFLTKLGAWVEMQGGLIRDHMERVAVNFGAIWRLILALESWAGQTDAQRAALWHAISDTQMENWEL